MIKTNRIYILLLIVIIILIGIIIFHFKKGDNKMDIIDGGVVRRGRLKGYEEIIKSKDIISFEYHKDGFHASCKLDNDTLQVTSKGGNYNNRDGTYFVLNYSAQDKTLLKKLQYIIDKHNISKDNGYENEVAGLPAGLGDNISVIYESGEKIWKYSNQSPTLSKEASNEIYETFHKYAKDNGYDFTSKGSNVALYDDADKNYVQGTWEGTHFGKKYTIIFKDNNIKIYEDDKLTDNCEYKIIEGNIVVNKLKKGVYDPKDRYDYEEFSVISTIKKKNDFTMVAYFMKDSYSTCDLLKQK
ncbi:MAG: hypothetical protein IKF19_06650 [Bacilli bacterium]|nr:hypothetical protein [Bacilli bacterium]